MFWKNRKAFSMLELLMGIVIFGLAILPIIWLSSTQTKGAYSVGKHMMAGQIATSLLDEKLKLGFDECVEEVGKLNSQRKEVLNENSYLREIVGRLNNETAEKDIEVSFKNFHYQFSCDKSEVDKKIFRVNIEVFYRVVEGDPKSERSIKLSAIKFGEKNG